MRQPEEQKSSNPFAYLAEMHLNVINASIRAGKYVYPDELAAALRRHGERPVPIEVTDYICRMLEDDIKKPKGRKARSKADKLRWNMLIRGTYHRYLIWLQQRKTRDGHLMGWKALQTADFWQGPAHEKAARMTAQFFGYGPHAFRRIQNIASAQK